MTSNKILVVSSKRENCNALIFALHSWGFEAAVATATDAAIELFAAQCPRATLLDNSFSEKIRCETLNEIKKLQPDAIVIFIGANMSVDEIIATFRAGAYDIISEPLNLEEIQETISRGIEAQKIRQAVRRSDPKQLNPFKFEQIIGESPAIKQMILLAQKVATSNVSSVLLQGESGTGKDLVAKAIHYSSQRDCKSFVAINCATIPANLLESELFGYEKGAFTDAKTRKEGLFEQAEGGTLFLDEIGELSLELQAKLLRVIEEGVFRRVGGLRDLPLNIRVIAASNRNLRAESEIKRFRLDLYYRLSVIQIDLPPLHERGDDVLLLAAYFIKMLDNSWSRNSPRRLSPKAEEVFRRYAWPGNVRELRNAIERALILEESELITTRHLPRELLSDNSYANDLNGLEWQASRNISFPADGVSLDMVEKWLVQQALKHSGGNVTRAGRLLRVSRDRIRYHLKKNKLKEAQSQNGKLVVREDLEDNQ